ncbi:hypothetical protein [Streptomyces zaomyceticus]|uniref:Transposase n=1 Tax=Streptomyces zaomyceticus TaxID=68286 RepID=A0ABZ1KZV0_9ACTN
MTPPHRKFKKNAPDWYEEMHECWRKAHPSRRIRVEHGIARLKNCRSPTRHRGRREHMSDTVQAVSGLLSHQQTADLSHRRKKVSTGATEALDVSPLTVHEPVRRVRQVRGAAGSQRRRGIAA